ncbi:hypothetical protein F5876DRAFT_82409 [Lentinula aff. lateritia]|uniref:Uncharacterized protein n=1 Tax=Lentinula aff. lateritia TaxID=2804960 RepID=A0ACC1TK13_9AGAR|nr:hypothetical protein F5876DRAFT_82409 [Lentinula aff. lateritia]
MTILTVVMYCISTVHLALSVRMNLVALFTQKAADGGETLYDDQGSPLYFGQVAFEVINCVLGDSIVTWRTWVLWGRDWRAIYFPCFLMGLMLMVLPSRLAVLPNLYPTMAFLVTGSVMVYQFSLSPPGQPNFSNNTTIWFSLFGGFSFLTNFYAVIVISLKTWLHQRKMKRVCVDVVVNGPRYYGALFLVIESGGIYCIAVILVIIFFVQSSNVVIILADMLAHLTGIYPTVIIVLVCLKLTQHDEMTRKEATLASMQFRGHPLATTTIQNEPMNLSKTYPLRQMKFNGRSHVEGSPADGSSDDIDEGNLGLSRKESEIRFEQHDVVIDFDEE